ncbi:Uncharacterized protein GBIM_16491 [Gryllus bimaculatus]|nr:Uncharacterized protein GBIM_16491 [Gryllus bimaculatus]
MSRSRSSSWKQTRVALTAWAMLALLAGAHGAALLSVPAPAAAAALPAAAQPEPQTQLVHAQARKFAEKPNALKKVAVDNDLDDVSTNSIAGAGEGFSWSSMLSAVMQLLFSPQQPAPSKSDGLDADQGLYQSPWTNLLSMGLKIISAFITGGTGNGGDGIDKVDNGSPMQGILAAVLSAVLGNRNPDQVATMAKQAGEFINIVVNLLDALKTSFSHRYMEARNIGRRDSVAEAAVAGLTMIKGYVRTLRTSDDSCAQRLLCDASRECASDTQGAVFCQMGAYATSFLLERTGGGAPFSQYYDASRRGRSGDDCRSAFLTCNEV